MIPLCIFARQGRTPLPIPYISFFFRLGFILHEIFAEKRDLRKIGIIKLYVCSNSPFYILGLAQIEKGEIAIDTQFDDVYFTITPFCTSGVATQLISAPSISYFQYCII